MPDFYMDCNLSIIEMPTHTVLALLALFAYVFVILPHRRRKNTLAIQRDLQQARMAISEMEGVVGELHRSTAEHYARLKKLNGRIAKLGKLPARTDDATWHELCCEVEGTLGPTLKLVSQIASAQECIRYHSTNLQRFSEQQVDPLTGVSNRRALESMVAAQFHLLKRYATPFSLAIVDIDHFKGLNDQQGHLHGDEALRGLANLLVAAVRTVDAVARYGGDEFVVIMPQTDLVGAATLAHQLPKKVAEALPFTISVGAASAGDADTAESLFGRADAALYRAKSEGRNRAECQRGQAVEPPRTDAPSTGTSTADTQSDEAFDDAAALLPS